MKWKPVTEVPQTTKNDFGIKSAPLIVWGSFGQWSQGEYVGYDAEHADFRTCPYIPIGDITHWAQPEAPNVELRGK